jgi:hypothetical protein
MKLPREYLLEMGACERWQYNRLEHSYESNVVKVAVVKKYKYSHIRRMKQCRQP